MKFHDNIHGEQYGPDHALTDNWNPDREFTDDQYIKVHFRIDAKDYDFQHGFNNAIDRELFYQEMKAILSRFSVLEGTDYDAKKTSSIEHLYIHPQDISGTIKQKNVKAIAEAIDGCSMCSCRWVDLYEEVYDMTEESFLCHLKEQKQAIKADLAALYATKRSNLYIVPSMFNGPETKLVKKYHIFRKAFQGYDDGPLYSFLCNIREEMVLEGLLVKGETRNGTGYRTAKQAKKAA